MRNVALVREMRNTYKILVENHEGTSLDRPGLMWWDNIKIDVGETGFGVRIWLVWLRIRTVMSRVFHKRRNLLTRVRLFGGE